jgi:hypothetical protein
MQLALWEKTDPYKAEASGIQRGLAFGGTATRWLCFAFMLMIERKFRRDLSSALVDVDAGLVREIPESAG